MSFNYDYRTMSLVTFHENGDPKQINFRSVEDTLRLMTVGGDGPQKKRDIAITQIADRDNFILFYASEQLAQSLNAFGTVFPKENSDCWQLNIDARYDFDEVVNHIKEMSQQAVR